MEAVCSERFRHLSTMDATHSAMDLAMVGPWLLSFRNTFGQAMVMVGPWMLSRQNASDHEHYHGWPMEQLGFRCAVVSDASQFPMCSF